jgi:hypothetical protein
VGKRQHGWSIEYARFLLKVGAKYRKDALADVVRWTRYSLVPGTTRPVHASRTFTCDEVDSAVAAFARDGFVVLSDALSCDEAQSLYRTVRQKADDIVRQFEQGDIPPESLHGPNRYSYGEYGHNPEWEYLGHNERVLPILRGIWQGHSFRAVAAGGDFVLPGGMSQALHNDLSWSGAGERTPRILIVNYYVSDVLPISGPIRIVPRTARFPIPPHRVIERFEPDWMKRATITGKPGYAVIRDPRSWHGGTPNTSTDPRYMPNIEYVVNAAPDDELESTATLDQLSRGRWIAEFANA